MKLNIQNYALILISSILTWGCSKQEASPKDKLGMGLTISPLKAKIGDTVTIKGSNLNKILGVVVENKELGLYIFKIIKKSDSEIVAIVPEVINEKVNLKFINQASPSRPANYTVFDSLNYDIVGLFSIYSYPQFNGRDIPEIDFVSQDIYLATDRKNLLISKNGGYKWEVLATFDGALANLFFINEKTGWVSIITDKTVNGVPVSEIRFTNDAGKSFQTLNLPNLNGEYVTDMFFSTATKSYLMTNKGTFLHTTNNKDFAILYKFPESHVSNSNQFSYFSLFDDYIMSTGFSGLTGDKPVFILGKGASFKFKYMNPPINRIKQINGEITYATIENKLHISKNKGDSWEKLSDELIVNYDFFDSNYGIAVLREPSKSDHIIAETRNGGRTWKILRKLDDFIYTADIALSSKEALISGKRGLSWKYIKY